MSDHEGEPCEDWNTNCTHRPNCHDHDDQHLEPEETELISIDIKGNPLQLQSSTTNKHPQRRSYHPVNRRVAETGFPGSNSRTQRQQVPDEQFDSSKLEAAINWRKGLPEDDFYTFQVTWETIVSNIPKAKIPPKEIARSKLNDICRVTEAWIPTPSGASNRADIWGHKEQIERAKILLEGFEKHVRVNRERLHEKRWSKIKPHSAAEQAQLQREEELKMMEDRMDELGDQLKYDHEGYLLLPELFDLEKFSIRYRKTILLPLQREMSCRIRFQAAPKCICLGADYEDNLVSTLLRVRNIVTEYLRGDQCLIVNCYFPPTLTEYRDRVRLTKSDKFSLYQACLEGGTLPSQEQNGWNSWQNEKRVRYRNKIRNFVEKSLTGMQTAQKHILMRVNFAMLGFSRCQLPAPGIETYVFKDFLAMVGHPFTKVESCHLQHIEIEPGFLITNLLESQAFGPPTTTYALQLDHASKDQVTLRYEALFAQSFADSEYEQAESRWTQFRKGQDENLLEVNMMAFGNLGTQLVISGQSLYDHPQSIERKIRLFASNIKFEPAPQGITAHPRRRWHIPHSDLNLVETSELTMVRFSYRDTSGVFELRRRDIYAEAKKSSKPTKSILSAHYYYPEWDNKLKELGSMKPGQEVSWTRSVDALFPTDEHDNELGALPRGFKVFMEEVDDIRGLLVEAIEKSSTLLKFD